MTQQPPTVTTLQEFHSASGEDVLLTVSLAAYLFNVSERRIRQLVDDGMPSFWDPKGLRIRWPAACRWRERQLILAGVRQAMGQRLAPSPDDEPWGLDPEPAA